MIEILSFWTVHQNDGSDDVIGDNIDECKKKSFVTQPNRPVTPKLNLKFNILSFGQTSPFRENNGFERMCMVIGQTTFYYHAIRPMNIFQFANEAIKTIINIIAHIGILLYVYDECSVNHPHQRHHHRDHYICQIWELREWELCNFQRFRSKQQLNLPKLMHIFICEKMFREMHSQMTQKITDTRYSCFEC